MDSTLIITYVLLIVCFLGLSWFAGSDAPYIPTKYDLIETILKLAKVKKGKIFYELGSGDGRVVLEAAKLGADSFGVEQSYLRVIASRISAKKKGLSNASFFHGNIFDRKYFPADVVYIYLLQKAVDKLERKLKKELKTGTVVITQTYHFKSWKPYKAVRGFNLYRV